MPDPVGSPNFWMLASIVRALADFLWHISNQARLQRRRPDLTAASADSHLMKVSEPALMAA
jgi:hypothetical protein